MNEQNIFDNQTFFEGYKKLRENSFSANEMVEKPAFFAMCPDVSGKRVLDLGCGYGENCVKYANEGAEEVVGIDLSEKMLAVAKAENVHHNVQFQRASMSDLSEIGETFDIITSSLAVHYIEDFENMVKQMYDLLDTNGVLIFSQEHPLTTAVVADECWAYGDSGEKEHYKLTDYTNQGERQVTWFVEGIVKYHRMFSEIINVLIHAGFIIEEVLEPMVDVSLLKRKEYRRYLHKPDFLLVRARKS